MLQDLISHCTLSHEKPAFYGFCLFVYFEQGDIPIIRRRKEETQPSNFSRDVSFGEDLSLFLPKVKPEDTGTYKCDIRANVGQRNKEGYVHLKVNGKLRVFYTSYMTLQESRQFKLS